MSLKAENGRLVRWLHEFSVPLILGVVCAVTLANFAPDFYHRIVHVPVTDLVSGSNATTAATYTEASIIGSGGHGQAGQLLDHRVQGHDAVETGHGQHDEQHGHGWSHFLTLHFLVNDLFMVLFFGVAAKEITEACLPNGALNPVSKAINPLFATVGGVVGPVAVYLGMNAVMGQPAWVNGWGIPTATDIALAWLVAKLIFGAGHPAISFLLLLAVADDAIGLGIIALAYPDPTKPTEWLNTLWIVPGMAVAYGLRRYNVRNWVPYVLIGGALSWWGLYSAHLHPALALVFIVPFLPGPRRDEGLFADRETGSTEHAHASPLENFEHQLRFPVDYGLFFFALANAGVSFSEVNGLTWIVVASLFLGKMFGVTLFSLFASAIGCRLPAGMNTRHLVVTGVIAGVGLTVALFVSGQAFADGPSQSAAKMGALFSAGVAFVAFGLAVALGVANFRLPGLEPALVAIRGIFGLGRARTGA